MAWSAESLLHDREPDMRSQKQRAIDLAGFPTRRWDAEMSLTQENVRLYADEPNAQQLVAKNAAYMLSRHNQGRMFLSPLETKNSGWKPELIPALELLIAAGTLTPETLTPELGAVISTFRNRYPNEILSPEIQAVFDTIPPTTLKKQMVDRYVTNPKLAKKLGGPSSEPPWWASGR